MESIIHHLVRLMAVQMVAAEVGPGPEEVARRRQVSLGFTSLTPTLWSSRVVCSALLTVCQG